MKSWGSFALALVACAVLGAASSYAASCRARNNDNCFNMPSAVNFSAVPDISRQIVSEEPAAAKPSVVEAPPITTYTGPTVGVSSMAHAPTIGYYWSLEPDSKNQ
ncbi:MAG TPA: hypothetical protein VGI28_01690 [Stellaceae bacterium]|jgi:hypothetical protein